MTVFKLMDLRRFKLNRQARVKTETEASYRNTENSLNKPGLANRFIPPQQNATKVRNLNIGFLREVVSSEVSVDRLIPSENQEANIRKFECEGKNGKVRNEVEIGETGASANKSKSLFGKTRSLSSACFSRISSKGISRGLYETSVRNLVEVASSSLSKTHKLQSEQFGPKVNLGKEGSRGSDNPGELQQIKMTSMSWDFKNLKKDSGGSTVVAERVLK